MSWSMHEIQNELNSECSFISTKSIRSCHRGTSYDLPGLLDLEALKTLKRSLPSVTGWYALNEAFNKPNILNRVWCRELIVNLLRYLKPNGRLHSLAASDSASESTAVFLISWDHAKSVLWVECQKKREAHWLLVCRPNAARELGEISSEHKFNNSTRTWPVTCFW